MLAMLMGTHVRHGVPALRRGLREARRRGLRQDAEASRLCAARLRLPRAAARGSSDTADAGGLRLRGAAFWAPAARAPIPSASPAPPAPSAAAPRCGRYRRSGVRGAGCRPSRAAPRNARGRRACPACRRRAGDAGDRDREIGVGMPERAARHRVAVSRLTAPKSPASSALHAEHRVLGLVGVGDEAAVDHGGGAGDFGQRAGDQAAGAGFRRGDHQLALLQRSSSGGRGRGCRCRSSRSPRPGQAHGGGRHGGDAFLAAGEAELLAGGRLHRDARRSQCPAISAMRFRMASRSGPIRGASQTMVTSRWAILPPRAATRSTANFRNWSEDGALPSRIVRRKMLADVAVGERAEDGVDQRMQADVGIGMRRESRGRAASACRRARRDRRRRRRARRSRCRCGCRRAWRRGGLLRGRNLPGW